MRDDVALREVQQSDLEVFFANEQDAEAARLANFAPRDRERFMRHWQTRVLGDPTGAVRAITVAGELAGNIVAWWEQERRFVGYWLGREFWGGGVGSAALALFLRAEQNRPLWADPAAANVASVRLLERYGFRRVDTLDYEGHEHVLLSLR